MDVVLSNMNKLLTKKATIVGNNFIYHKINIFCQIKLIRNIPDENLEFLKSISGRKKQLKHHIS